MIREELIWRMAEQAFRHYYCKSGADGDYCEHCRSKKSAGGEIECFELSTGFKRGADTIDWRNAADGALCAVEAALGVKFVGDAKP